MREILFRGKDKDDGNWYEGYYLQLHDTTYCCMSSDNVDEANRLNKENEHHYIVFEQMTDWGLPNKHLRAEVAPETVCQYTGLTDKNGRKIFEGDIIKINEDVKEAFGIFDGSVIYRGGSFIIGNSNSSGMLNSLFVISDINYVLRGEVIGNIFDNPDLIGE